MHDKTDEPDGWDIIAVPKDEATSKNPGYDITKQWWLTWILKHSQYHIQITACYNRSVIPKMINSP